jgi:hypothetical protein
MSELINMKQASEWYVLLTNIKGDEVDITTTIQQLSVYESIYNNSMFGTLIIEDDTGFIETLGLIGSGEETIEVFIETPNASENMETNNIEKVFVINSLTNVNRVLDGTGKTTFSLGFVSPYLVKNNTTKISRSFNAMTSSEIVEYTALDILEIGGDDNFDFSSLVTNTPTKYTKNIVVPNWKPFDLMNFLAKNSISVDGNSNYIFFENNEGFHFTTIEDLKQQEIIRMITVNGTNDAGNKQGGIGEILIEGNNAESYDELTRFDISSGTSNGMYGGRMVAHNILTKSVETHDITNTPKGSKLGDVGFGDVFRKDQEPSSHIGYMSSNYLYDVHDKEERSHYPLYDMKISELRSNLIKLTLPGDTNVFAGNTFELLLPSTSHDSQEMDRYMSGNYFITAIHHKINSSGYEMTMECSKDGFDFELDESTMEQ